MFLSFMELGFAAVMLLFIVTQIIVPGFRGTPLFPFFRRERHLAAELEVANEEVLEEALRRKIKRRRRAAERLRRKMELALKDEAGAMQPQNKPAADAAQEGER